jgi:hypothetical protein
MYNFQIIATTDSDECIRACKASCNDDKIPDETISLMRLDKIDDKHVAVSYPSIETAIEKE